MLNKNPIFLVGFARGGSNIVLNLLRSHPNVCSPRGETQEVFKGKGRESYLTRLGKRISYLPVMMAERHDVFSIDRWYEIPPFKKFSQKRIDSILYHDKVKATEPGQNFYKAQNIPYSKEEIYASRILCKNLNGLIFLTPQFASMYPDACFIALVRNGYAVIEGHLRRGLPLESFAENYLQGCRQIIKDSQRFDNYNVFRYEDFIDHPQESLQRLFTITDLSLDEIEKIRLQTKRVIQTDGSHHLSQSSEEKELLWYDTDKYFNHFIKGANENQIRRLTENQRRVIGEICGEVLEYFNYDLL